MRLCDARVCFGRDVALEPFQFSDVAWLGAMMEKYGVARAFVLAFASSGLDFRYGNALAFAAAAQDPRLIPCPAVIPNAGDEIGGEEEFIADLVNRGARCVSFHPRRMGVPLRRMVIEPLFAALARRRLPVMIHSDQADTMAVADLAAAFPEAPVIYVSPSYRNRALLPAMLASPNLHITINAPFGPNEGLEWLVGRCGAERILFASNFPVAEPGTAIAYLMCSRLDAADVEKIASGNMERLIAEVRHE